MNSNMQNAQAGTVVKKHELYQVLLSNIIFAMG